MYHEISQESLDSVFRDGLKRTSRGKKSQDPAIIKTDQFLDKECPTHLKTAGVCRSKNIYCFLGDETSLIDIKNGRRTLLSKYKPSSGCILLKLNVSPNVCYVSDLDLYDGIKATVTHNRLEVASRLARDYWRAVIPLGNFNQEDIARPEVLVTCDATPSQLSIVT